MTADPSHQQGALEGAAFAVCVEQVPVPTLCPGDIVLSTQCRVFVG